MSMENIYNVTSRSDNKKAREDQRVYAVLYLYFFYVLFCILELFSCLFKISFKLLELILIHIPITSNVSSKDVINSVV